MADRYRKGSTHRVVINCKVTAEAKAYLNKLAGEYAIGYAIEQLVEGHRKQEVRKPHESGTQQQWKFIPNRIDA